MKLKRQVVMLPTNEKAVEKEDIVLNYPHSMFIATNNMRSNSLIADYYKSQHLYITSDDEEIKEGDWCIQNGNYLCRITCNQDRTSQGLKKIIATTDKSLGLPSPSDGFIKKFIERYNAGNNIAEVMVEYEEWPVLERITGTEASFRTVVKKLLKVDKNNCITIKAVKESWTREERNNDIVKAIKEAISYPERFVTGICFDDKKANEWIDQNL